MQLYLPQLWQPAQGQTDGPADSRVCTGVSGKPAGQLTICGQGEEEGALRRLIAELGMEQRIELAGLRPREEIAKRLAQTDCFVLASESETFGVSYLEALSCGVPVIATAAADRSALSTSTTASWWRPAMWMHWRGQC